MAGTIVHGNIAHGLKLFAVICSHLRLAPLCRSVLWLAPVNGQKRTLSNGWHSFISGKSLWLAPVKNLCLAPLCAGTIVRERFLIGTIIAVTIVLMRIMAGTT